MPSTPPIADSRWQARGGVTVIVRLEGLVDFGKGRERLQKEIALVDKDLVVMEKKLKNPAFVEHAPREVVQKGREHQAELVQKRSQLEAAIRGLS